VEAAAFQLLDTETPTAETQFYILYIISIKNCVRGITVTNIMYMWCNTCTIHCLCQEKKYKLKDTLLILKSKLV
jgi:hypothetical protein